MKKFADVEKTRKAYHSAPDRNSVHRSAAIFALPDTGRYRAEVAFLNHWRIKRGIPEIGARHTLRDGEGGRIGQVMDLVDRDKVYAFDLEEMAGRLGLDAIPDAGSWEVEFFSARNMFIPYPAVVMNNWNGAFYNQVHAYARTLADADEDAAINRTRVREASMDVRIDETHDTFVEVLNGPVAAESEIAFVMEGGGATREARRPFRAAPYGKRSYRLSEVFGEDAAPVRADRTLFLQQPEMPLFFARVWGGPMLRDGEAFAANHSYYDNRATGEYWTVDPANRFHSSKVFPLIDGLDLVLRLYPIHCPCDMDFHAVLYDGAGRAIAERRDIAAAAAAAPGILELPLGRIGREAGAAAAELTVTPRGDKVPMRIALQVCYGTGSGLDSSINISLLSPYVFWPEGKPGRAWCEVAGTEGVDNRLGLYHTAPFDDGEAREVLVTLYRTADEEVRTARITLKGKQPWAGELTGLFPDCREFLGGRPGFVYAESTSQFLRALSLQTNRMTGHTSGEHGF